MHVSSARVTALYSIPNQKTSLKITEGGYVLKTKQNFKKIIPASHRPYGRLYAY